MKFGFLLAAYFVVTAANGFAFVTVAERLGGDALNGYSQAGINYLCIHGSCHKVDSATFTYSLLHALSVIVMFAALILWMAIKQRRKNSN